MKKSLTQPWEPVAHWEHGRVAEKYVQGGEGLVLAARVVAHLTYGVAWFVYDFQGKLVGRGDALSIVLAQLTVDSDAIAHTNSASISA